MAGAKFELIYTTGDSAGESIELDAGGGETCIGRSRTNDVVLNDPLVSRQHLRLEVRGDTVMVHDLGSSHGTFLNDKRIRGSVSLNPGDILQVGETKFSFSAPDSADGD